MTVRAGAARRLGWFLLLSALAGCGGGLSPEDQRELTVKDPEGTARQAGNSLILKLPNQCRDVLLIAGRSYLPPVVLDAVERFNPTYRTQLPKLVPVVTGSGRNGRLDLTLELADGQTVTCTYRGDAPGKNGRVPQYQFDQCSIPVEERKTVLELRTARLHVASGDPLWGPTVVAMTLAEEKPCGGGDGGTPDGGPGPGDGGVVDGGVPDAGGGPPDGGVPDGGGGPPDGGTGTDAGTPPDAGGGPNDGGTGTDAGTPPDAGGGAPDGGTGVDAGTPPDGGQGADGGTGIDAGTDGGVVDVTPPEAFLEAPAPGTITSAASVPVVVRATDPSGISGVQAPGLVFDLQSDGRWHGTLPLVEGTNGLDISVFDGVGNQTHLTLSVVRDTQLPDVQVVTPAEGAKIGALQTRLSGTVNDATAVALTLNGGAVPLDGGIFDLLVGLDAGSNALALAATDQAGNVGRVTRTVRANATPPTVVVDTPADGSSTASTVITVRGTARPKDPTDSLQLTVAGTPAVVAADGSFATTVSLSPGDNAIAVVAIDGYGLQTTVAPLVTRTSGGPGPDGGGGGPDGGGGGGPDGGSGGGPDGGGTTPDAGGGGTPDGGGTGAALVLQVDTPSEGLMSRDAVLAVSGRVTGGTPPIQVKVNGTAASLASGFFSAGPALGEGPQTVTIVASDSAGAQTSTQRNVTIDRTAPILVVTRPSQNPAKVNETPFLMQGTVTDLNFAQLTLNGAPVPVIGGAFSVAVPLTAGMTTVQLVATDLAGNVTQLNQQFTVDSAPPDIVVISPTDGSVSTKAAVDVSFRVQATASLTSVTVGSGAATEVSPGNYSATVPLSLGDNSIPIRAVDSQGQSASVVVHVRYSDVKLEPLRVTGVNPSANATDVETDALVSVSFNKPVVLGSLSGNFVVLRNGQPLPGSLAPAPGSQTVSFIAAGPLPESETLTVQVANVQAQDGPAMADSFASQFTIRRPLTVVRGTLLDEQQHGMSGVRVSFPGSSLETRTGPDGNWLLFGPPTGIVVVRYDASTSADGRQYPSVQRRLYVQPEVTTAVAPIIQFPVDTRSLQFIDGTDTAHLTFAGRHPGLSIDVQASGLSFEDGSTAGFVTMTQVPSFALPVPVSGRAPPGKLWRMEPAGIRLTGTVAFTLPNLSQLAPNRLALLLAYDPASRSMQRVGFGRASDDGSKIVPLPGVAVNSLEYVGYAPLDDNQSAAVEAVLAQSGIGSGSTDGGQGAFHRFQEEPWWKRALSNAIIAQAHAQGLIGLFMPAFSAYDGSSLSTIGLTTIFGKVRTPRLREVQIQLVDPLETAFPSSAPVSKKDPLHIDFTASEASNDSTGGFAGPVTGRLSATSPTGAVLAPPAGETWSATADGGVEVVGNVPLSLGKTTITLDGLATFGHSATVLEANLVAVPDGGPNDALLTVTKKSSGEDEELVAGTVRFSNTRVTVTSDSDQSSVTGASGGYSVLLSLYGPQDAIACADVPIAPKPVERPGGQIAMVDDTFSACSVNTTVYGGSSQRLDVVVDARVLYGAVDFSNKDGTPVEVICGAGVPSSWSADGGVLDAISEDDLKTTEVHFFKEGNLDQPIAKVAYVLTQPGLCPKGGDAQGAYTRVRIGPADRFKAAQRAANRAACNAISDPTKRSPDDDVFWRLNCAPELGFFSGLQTGDRLVVFAINHATGYAGIANVTVPAINQNPNPTGTCPADDAAGGPQQVTENGETYTISRCTIQDLGVPTNLKLYPPEIDVRLSRQAVEEGYGSHPVKHLIRTSGGATTKDQFLQFETHWRVRRKANADPSTAYDGGPPILCTGKLCPDAGPIVDVGDQGPLLEQFCSEVDPNSSAALSCLQDDSELTDVPAGVPPLKGRVVRITGSAVEQPDVVRFDVKPRRGTAALALGTNVDGKITSTLLRSNYYLHIVGYAIQPRDKNSDGILEPNETTDSKQPDPPESNDPPPPFMQGSGPIGMPAKALQIKNVYSAFEPDGGIRLRYDQAREHEVRVFDIQEAIAKSDGPDGGTVLSETQGAAPGDSAYQLFLRLEQPDPARTGPKLSDLAIRLGSDAFGIECKVTADTNAGTLTGDCNGADLDEVISVHDVLYLEAYLRGNAENAIYRFNFQGLAARKDYVTAGSTFTAENSNKTDSELGTANRPISQPAFTTFPIKPSELSSGSIRICVDDCNKKVLDSATLTYAAGNYTISNETGTGDEALEKLKDIGTESARFFRLLIPNEFAALPGGGVDPPQIILELSPLTPKPIPPFTRVLGRPKGAFNGEHSEATGQATLGGVNLADGHLALDFEDFSAPEFMTQVRFVRTYNNQNDDFTEMGHGWTHNFHGEVVQENEHRYTVIIGAQSYDFPRCNSNADCPSDNSHGGTLTITGDDPDLTILFEHPDGRHFWFQRKAQNSDRKGRHRWLLEAIDDGHARQTAPNGDGWVRLEYFDQTNLLRTVHRNGGLVTLDFQYEGPDRATSPDRPGPFRVRAESEDLQLLKFVFLSAGGQTVYTTSFEYDEATTNLLSAFTLGTAPDVATVPQLWQYGYDPLQQAPKGFPRWVLANELNTAQLLLNGHVQWDARYLRELSEGDQPYPHLAAREVVTSVTLPGYNRKPFTIGYNGGSSRSILRPDGVPVTVTLNGYGAPNLFQLPGTSTATQWENDATEGAKVAPKASSTGAGTSFAESSDTRLRPSSRQLNGVGGGRTQGLGFGAGSTLVQNDYASAGNERFGVPLNQKIPRSDGNLATWTTALAATGDVTSVGVDGLFTAATSFDADGVPDSGNDPIGRSISYSGKDTFGRPTSVTYVAASQDVGGAASATVDLTYDGLGRLSGRTVSTSGTISSETSTYDSIGRLRSRIVEAAPSDGQSWTWNYAEGDNTLQVETILAGAYRGTTTYADTLKVQVDFDYDSPAKHATWTYQYDGGRLVAKTERGFTAVYAYSDERLAQIQWQPSLLQGALTEWQAAGFDGDDNVIAYLDDLQLLIQKDYDSLGRAVASTSGGVKQASLLDAQGNGGQELFGSAALEHGIDYGIDALGHPTRASSAAGSVGGLNTVVQHDAYGRMLSRADLDLGSTETWNYGDALGRLTRYRRTIVSNGATLVFNEDRTYVDAVIPKQVLIVQTIDTGLPGADSKRTRNEVQEIDRLGRVVSRKEFWSQDQKAVSKTSYLYDPAGRMKLMIDPAGGTTTWGYDNAGALVTRNTPDDQGQPTIRTTYHVDEGGLVVDQLGPHQDEHWTMSYDQIGRLLTKTLLTRSAPGTTTWQYAYVAQGPGTVLETDPDGFKTLKTYNGFRQVVSEKRFGEIDNQITSYVYDGTWLKSRATGIENGSWSFVQNVSKRDDRGRPLVESESFHSNRAPPGYTYDTTTDWTGQTARRTVRGPLIPDRVSQLTVDSLGNLVQRKTMGDDLVTDLWTYDAAGLLSSETPGGQAIRSYIRKESALVTERFGGAKLEETTYEYHPDIPKVIRYEPLVEGASDFRALTRTFSKRSLLIEEKYGRPGDEDKTTYSYDLGGFLSQRVTAPATSGENTTWTYTHDPLGALLEVSQPSGIGTFDYEYDGRRNLTRIPQAEGAALPEQKFTYDYLGRLKTRTRGGSTWSTQWRDNVGTTFTPVSDTIEEVVDGRGRRASISYTPGGSLSTDYLGADFLYDPQNQLLKATERRAHSPALSTTRTYDGNGRLKTEVRGGDTVTYGYKQGTDLLESIISPAGAVNYKYDDDFSRVSSSTGPLGSDIALEWEAGGQRLLATSDSNLFENRCWDARGRVTTITHANERIKCGTTPAGFISRYSYVYDERGNRTRQDLEDSQGKLTTEYGYDAADRLVIFKNPDLSGASYTLKPEGSRDVETLYGPGTFTGGLSSPPAAADVRTYAYDARGALKSITGRSGFSASFDHDDNGRRISDGQGGVTRTYQWDASDRLVSVRVGSNLPTGYTYDYAGLRRARTGTNTADFLWAGGDLVEERLSSGSHVYQRGGGLLLAAGNERVGLDSLQSAVVARGAVSRQSAFDPWGNYLVVAGRFDVPPPASPSAGFAGTSYETLTGLHYGRERWLDPASATWLSQDAAFGAPLLLAALSPWQYAYGNPLRYVDPSGLLPEPASRLLELGMAAFDPILTITIVASNNYSMGEFERNLRHGELDNLRTGKGNILRGLAGQAVFQQEAWRSLAPAMPALETSLPGGMSPDVAIKVTLLPIHYMKAVVTSAEGAPWVGISREYSGVLAEVKVADSEKPEKELVKGAAQSSRNALLSGVHGGLYAAVLVVDYDVWFFRMSRTARQNVFNEWKKYGVSLVEPLYVYPMPNLNLDAYNRAAAYRSWGKHFLK